MQRNLSADRFVASLNWRPLKNFPTWPGLALLAMTLHGCGSPGEPAAIHGNVSWQGTPVAKGAIRFIAENGTPGLGGVAPIKDGRFEIPDQNGLKAGQYIVAIYGFRETGRMIRVDESSPEIPEEQQYIPRQYNDASTQFVELDPGLNQLEYSLSAR
jgi:hypothetical protein